MCVYIIHMYRKSLINRDLRGFFIYNIGVKFIFPCIEIHYLDPIYNPILIQIWDKGNVSEGNLLITYVRSIHGL